VVEVEGLPYHVIRACLDVVVVEVEAAEEGFQDLAFGSCCPGLVAVEDAAVRTADPGPHSAETDVVVVVDGEAFVAAACFGQSCWVDSGTVGSVSYPVACFCLDPGVH
jgi:hypothetical protein